VSTARFLTSPATPTTVNGLPPKLVRMIGLPIGSSPGKYSRAAASLMMITGCDVGVSSSPKSRPRSGMRIARK
jgi:hypothetical protein